MGGVGKLRKIAAEKFVFLWGVGGWEVSFCGK